VEVAVWSLARACQDHAKGSQLELPACQATWPSIHQKATAIARCAGFVSRRTREAVDLRRCHLPCMPTSVPRARWRDAAIFPHERRAQGRTPSGNRAVHHSWQLREMSPRIEVVHLMPPPAAASRKHRFCQLQCGRCMHACGRACTQCVLRGKTLR